jgi:hypothetical protein
LSRLRRYARVLTGACTAPTIWCKTPWRERGTGADSGELGSDLRAWLFAIMHNVHVDQFSLRQRERAHVSHDADDGPATGWEVPVRATRSDRNEVNELFAQLGQLPVEDSGGWLGRRRRRSRRSNESRTDRQRQGSPRLPDSPLSQEPTDPRSAARSVAIRE